MISECSNNWEADYHRLREEMMCKEAQHHDEKEKLKRRIAELEQELMIYEQKWSVINLIFGKQV